MALKIFTFAWVLAAAQAGVIAGVAVRKSAPAQYAQYSAPAQVAQYPAKPKASHYAALAPMTRYATPAQVPHYAQGSKYAVPAQVPHYARDSKYAASMQVARRAAPTKDEEYAPAEYSFEYSVHDEHTGDIKSQKETRNGDEVKGYYTLIEADGRRRIVEYSADKHSGFNAVVRHEPSLYPAVQARAPKPIQRVLKPVVTVATPVHLHKPAAKKPSNKIGGPLLTISSDYSPKGYNVDAPIYTISAPKSQRNAQVGSNEQEYAQATSAKYHNANH